MIRILCVLVAMSFFAGCNESENGTESALYSVKKYTSSNGMPCLIYSGSHGGGISCDWDFKTNK